MLHNKRGISDVVMTVIMIVLVLIAVGVVWVTVQGLLNKNKANIDVGQKCIGLGFEISEATCQEELGDNPDTLDEVETDFALGTYACSVKIVRSAGVSGETISGVGLTFDKDEITAGMDKNIAVSQTFTAEGLTSLPTKVDARFYLDKGNGEKYFCPGVTATANIA